MALNLHDAALGAFLGACAGDAAGATLEFKSSISPTKLESALAMEGGGVWKTAPGQITDDGELTMSLAHALTEATDGLTAVDRSATWYLRWVQSSPFDIGTTTRASLGSPRAYESIARGMKEAATENCMQSKSNGSLMRATPLAIWGHRLSASDLQTLVKADCTLSHPNPAVVSADVAYVMAIAYLLRHPGDRQGAWLTVDTYGTTPDCDKETQKWIQQIRDGKQEPAQPQIGFVKIAFVNAFIHLRRGSDYLTAITETLKMGGDTDTNACITGGLIGAAVGVDDIPVHMRKAVLECDVSEGKQPRPSWLTTKQIPALVARLLANAPSTY